MSSITRQKPEKNIVENNGFVVSPTSVQQTNDYEDEANYSAYCQIKPKYLYQEEIDPRIAAYEVQPLVEIQIEGVFNSQMADYFEYEMRKAIAAKHELILIRINSPGGEVGALNRMVGTLETAKTKAICATVCTGIAMSCGSILLAMGTPGYRYCSEHGKVLLHEISGGMRGTQTGMENEIAEYCAENAELFRKIARNAGTETNYYLEFVKSLHKDLFISPHRALFLKLVDHIGIPMVKKKISIHYALENSGPDLTPEELRQILDEVESEVELLRLDPLPGIKAPQPAKQKRGTAPKTMAKASAELPTVPAAKQLQLPRTLF
jgi:ATP-dependent protease ClpP protease subunit